MGVKPLQIPKDNLVLLWDYPEGYNKIQDSYMHELFVVVDKHPDLKVYIIKPINGKGPLWKFNYL